MDTLAQQLLTALQVQNLPTPSQQWLSALVASRTPPPPLASLSATARARLLAADLTTPGLLDASYAATACLPAAALGAEVKEARLPRDVVVQVLDVEDVSRSRWEQVEELEAVERGERTRGREIIRLPVGGGEDEDGSEDVDRVGDAGGGGDERQGQGGRRAAGATSASAGKNSTHKLVLQDCKGRKAFGLELKRIDGLGVGKLNIGEKLLLKGGTVIARGSLLLEPANCIILGGKVEAWQKAWTEGRLARLRDATGVDRRD